MEAAPYTGEQGIAGDSRVQLTLASSLEELKRAREAVDRFLEPHGLSDKAAYDVHLVFEEILTNVVKYAWDDENPHEIDLSVSVANESIALRVRDDGKPFDPREAPIPTPASSLEEASVGGLGIEMVRQTARSIHYLRRGGYNEVEIVIAR